MVPAPIRTTSSNFARSSGCGSMRTISPSASVTNVFFLSKWSRREMSVQLLQKFRDLISLLWPYQESYLQFVPALPEPVDTIWYCRWQPVGSYAGNSRVYRYLSIGLNRNSVKRSWIWVLPDSSAFRHYLLYPPLAPSAPASLTLSSTLPSNDNRTPILKHGVQHIWTNIMHPIYHRDLTNDF